MLDPKRIRFLPAEYSYPYNLQQRVPEQRRAKVLNHLVCIACEERSLDPEVVEDILIEEPLRSWLAERYR